MVLSTIGMLLAAGAIAAWADKDSKKAYPKLTTKVSNDMDAEFGRYGIKGQNGRFTDTKIKMIAARNGVRTNKNGVLPEEGWKKCRSYVAKYANCDQDILDFQDAWYRTVYNQMKAHGRTLQDPNSKLMKDYKSNARYFNAPSHKSEWQQQTIVLEINHWHTIPEEEQIKRMNELQDQTYWGNLCVEPPILRNNPHSHGHIEVWMLHASSDHKQGSSRTKRFFKNRYKECCAKLGYDAML